MEQKNNQSDKVFSFTEQEATWIVAAVFIMLIFSFTAGYYLGKWHSSSFFMDYIERSSFTDRVYSSMAHLYHDVDDDAEEGTDDVIASRPVSSGDTEAENALPSRDSDYDQQEPVQITHIARLAGFGKRGAAQSYCHRLQQRHIQAEVVDRVSKTKNGKRITWFQVVVRGERAKLEQIVEQLKKDDKLTSVEIVSI